jgi:hypothetical protein
MAYKTSIIQFFFLFCPLNLKKVQNIMLLINNYSTHKAISREPLWKNNYPQLILFIHDYITVIDLPFI